MAPRHLVPLSSDRPPVLVTGGAGFVGVAVVRQLLASGEQVVALDNFCVGSPTRLVEIADHSRLSVVEGDIRDERSFRDLFDEYHFDTVIHLAAHHFIPFCIANPAETLDVNVTGTQRLLDASQAHGVRKFVFTSTADVYEPSQSAHSEHGTTLPNNIYGVSKLMGEQLLDLFGARCPEAEVVVARLFNVYGPGETNPHLLPDILDYLRSSDNLTLGNVTSRRDYVFCDDIAGALVCLARRSTGQRTTVNVGTGKSWTARDLVEMVASLTQRNLQVYQDPSKLRPVDRPELRASIDALRSTLPDMEWTSLEEGLRRTLISEGLL